MTAAAPAPAELPAGHRILRTIDLKNDPPVARAINAIIVLGIAVTVGLALASDFPPATSWSTPVVVLVTVAAVLAYVALHELTHGAALRVLSPTRPFYGVRFPFLTTGTASFLGRGAMIIVCLAPFVVWGLVFSVALSTLPDDALLTVYVLAAVNLCGSAGDFVQAFITAKLPPSAMLRDSGSATTVIVPAD